MKKSDPAGLIHPDAVTFNNYQTAVAAVLELMGTRTTATPVVCSVLSPPHTLSAILRSGGSPVLLDVCEKTLQIDAELLSKVLDELSDKGPPILVLNRPGGVPIDPRLMDFYDKMPLVEDAFMEPFPKPVVNTHFSVWDLQGGGAVVITSFKEQQRQLALLRDGFLGLNGAMVDVQKQFHSKIRLRNDEKACYGKYLECLRQADRSDMILVPNSTHFPCFLARVINLEQTSDSLKQINVPSLRAFYPVHKHPAMRRRWIEDPSYPVAEKLSEQVLALPVSGSLDVEEIVEILVKSNA
jgi:dTDP-4-amino-4,6-dideoxygalactose transaminase